MKESSPYLLALLSVLLWAALVPCAALAAREDAGAALREERFLSMDTDGDGFLSPEEFAAGFPHLREAAFSAMDADQDGRVSREEWRLVRLGHRSSAPHPGSSAADGSGDTPQASPGGGAAGAPDLLLPAGGGKP
jgi:hypothetical protein